MRLLRHVLIGGAALALALPAAATARYVPDHVMLDGAKAGHDMHMHARDLDGTSAAERRRARRFLRRTRRIARHRFPSLKAARARGYRKGARMSYLGIEQKRSDVHSPFVHYDNRRFERDGRLLDPRRPESLVYWKNPTGSPLLVGYMFRASSLRRPRDPHRLGRMMLWHAHGACDRRRERGNRYQFRTERCASGLAHVGPTVMTHLYFTRRLRTAYEMRVPTRALNVFIPGGGPMADVGG